LLVLARSANVAVPVVLKFIVDALEGVSAGVATVPDAGVGVASTVADAATATGVAPVTIGAALALVVGDGGLRTTEQSTANAETALR